MQSLLLFTDNGLIIRDCIKHLTVLVPLGQWPRRNEPALHFGAFFLPILLSLSPQFIVSL
ncbi:hypothetical protein SAMN04488056_101318 [Cohaesibacter marisflavi]|uniref:Uncharacterized protein n=1 Tax=Cohaesibacter marisflavi TaxID=655353 RepID=A0A1I5A2G2_9HYPH|nr:hypothetical protein SAMN04488056_101318 [Cohaesibacter marisflavi]